MFHKTLEFAEAGDNVGTLLRGIAKKDVERGQVLAAPKSIHPHTKFKGQVYVLSKDREAAVTPRSSTTTVPSSTSVPPT